MIDVSELVLDTGIFDEDEKPKTESVKRQFQQAFGRAVIREKTVAVESAEIKILSVAGTAVIDYGGEISDALPGSDLVFSLSNGARIRFRSGERDAGRWTVDDKKAGGEDFVFRNIINLNSDEILDAYRDFHRLQVMRLLERAGISAYFEE